MKKVLLLLATIAIIHSLKAQTVKVGIEGGVNFSNIDIVNIQYRFLNLSKTTGYHIGAVADIGIGSFSLQPSLLYATKGALSVTYQYLELPVNFLYHISVTKVCYAFVGAGPYLGYGVGASETGYNIIYYNFGSNQFDVQNPDFGINFLGGLCFKNGLFLKMNYDLGLSTLNNLGNPFSISQGQSPPNINGRNRALMLSLGYFFGSNRNKMKK